jgi:catechol 2,3-dioxygenase-like lactoylglutathione lyase family enzyme
MAINFKPELTCSMGVSDLDRSIDWYGKIMGCTLLYRVDDIGWCEMATAMPGVNIGLGLREGVEQGGGATNVFEVADIDAAKAFLDSHDVRQDGDIQHIPGLVRLLTFFDPDGNAFMFSQADQGN